MRNKLKQNIKGFTIIEVMIVLAIAGLILLIVFLAIPALQRSQANTGRKEDAGRLVTAWGNFVSNNNGTAPASTGDCQTVQSSAGKLSQYSNLSCNYPAAGQQGQLDINTAVKPLGGVTGNAVTFEENAICGSPSARGGYTPLAAPSGSQNQAIILYTIQINSSQWQWVCENVT